MSTLSVAEKGIAYLLLCLQKYSEGCSYILMYAAALLFVLLCGKREDRKVFLPQALMLMLTVFNPLFPMILNRIFDVNNEYYRFFWIAPVVILVAYVFADITDRQKGAALWITGLFFAAVIICGGKFLYADGYIKSPNIYKMPTEVPEIAEMIHEDADGRYEGDYYPRACFEFDYEMCLRQYDASIMMTADREAYLNAISGGLTNEEILSDENYYNRVLAVVALGQQLPPSEFKKGLENTGTEYVCISSVNEDLCRYLEKNVELRKVGETANHTLYHYELKDNEGWTLPDYSDVWENY